MTILIVMLLLAIVASLGQALYSMSSGPTESGKMVKALTIRISLSLALFILLLVCWRFGLIQPHGAR